MIKKIDANEYGVVKYAITSVDELNRLPKKIAPSSQAILIENGLRVFVYGDGQWVEEVVDGDLSENMKSIVADYERSKIGHDGVKRGSLEERLKDDFQGIYDILNARDYCEYSGDQLKVDNTWMGNQIDTRVEGRTLQNLVDGKNMIIDASDNTLRTISLRANLLKINTVYTFILNVKRNTLTRPLRTLSFEGEFLPPSKTFVEVGQTGIVKTVITTTATIKPAIGLSTDNISGIDLDIQKIEFDLMILEGDHTQTPLSELPYFEGIESVGEREIGKNLFDGVLIDGTISAVTGVDIETDVQKKTGYIRVQPNKTYSFSKNGNIQNSNIYYYSKDKEFLLHETNVTIYTPEECAYIRLMWNKGTVTNEDVLQLNEGTEILPYEPYGYKIRGKSCGKNLINLKKIKVNGETSINVIDNNTLEVSSNSSWGGILFDDIELKAGKKYTFTYDCENDLVTPYMTRKENGVYGTTTHYGGKNPIVVTPTNDMTVRVSISSKEAIDKVIIKNIILTESDDISYQPYQESTYSIYSPIPLRSLPSGVCDVYDFESGAVIQKVGKVVLDGSEEWHVAATEEKTIKVQTNSSHKEQFNCKGSTVAISDSFPYITGSNDIEHFRPDGGVPLGNFVVWINKDKLSSLDSDGFKQWLSQNPMTIYYELFTPIIHYLTPSQLKSFDGITHVVSENTLIPTTTTKILTDTYTNVSNVNSTAYSLRRGVNDVAETSAIINETDVEQDDVLDVTMCAIDELYSMLEPNLE